MSTRVKSRVSPFRAHSVSYAVLAVGGLLWVVGLYAVISGYQIIQIERGWATVIAGATMFTGGIVTAAVGLVLGALLRIEAALEARPMSQTNETMDPATPDDFEPTMRVPSRRPEIAEAAPFYTEPNYAEPRYAPPVFAAPLVAAAHDEPHGIADDIHPAFDEQAFARALELPLPDAPREAVPDHPDHYELQTPSTPEHDLTPSAETSPPLKIEPPSQDDWLDRAFSSLDEEIALGPQQRHPDHADVGHDASSHAPVAEAEHDSFHHHDDEHHDDEAALHDHQAGEDDASPADGLEWAPPAADVAVIGRYESDGTSYVMFADGSIEAHSEAGVYRFRSMAELKAFIEG